jgi:hypothetical protein
LKTQLVSGMRLVLNGASDVLRHNPAGAGWIIGTLTGATAAAILEFWLNGRVEVPYLADSFWFSVPVTWGIFCSSVGLLFSVRALRKCAPAATVVAGPGLLLLSRHSTGGEKQHGLSAGVDCNRMGFCDRPCLRVLH